MNTLDKWKRRMSDEAIRSRTDLDEQETEYLNSLVQEEVKKLKGKYKETPFLDKIGIACDVL